MAWVLALLGGLWAAAAGAETYAVVDALQSPAWLERGGERQPLVPGQELRNHDRIVSGEGGRVRLQLSDGSAVKLGEKAELRLNALGRREGNVFTAALDVATGAFRLTTDVLQRLVQKRAINVRVATITAGIRGTDVWGSSDAERDLVCLLEGRIVVSHPQGQPRQLDQPLQFYSARKAQAPGEPGQGEKAQVGLWAMQTEMQYGQPVQEAGGRWQLRLASALRQGELQTLSDTLREAGYPVRIKPILPRPVDSPEAAKAVVESKPEAKSDGKDAGAAPREEAKPEAKPVEAPRKPLRYELRLANLPSQEEAEQLAAQLAERFALPLPVVFRR
jgi:hypothetical protein